MRETVHSPQQIIDICWFLKIILCCVNKQDLGIAFCGKRKSIIKNDVFLLVAVLLFCYFS